MGFSTQTWKNANVKPLHKNFEPNSFRPVNLLSSFPKVFEKIKFFRIFSFIQTHKLLSTQHCDFQPRQSCMEALIHISEFMCRVCDSKEEVGFSCVIYIEKAFDTVDHDLWTLKLKWYGFRVVFLDFLRD